jgi:outer membrane protein TolC
MHRSPAGGRRRSPAHSAPPRRLVAALVTVLLFATGDSLGAQPARSSSDTVRLSIDHALAMVGSESEEIRLARSNVSLADAQVRAARAAALPQLDGNASYLRTFATPFAVGPITLPDSLRFLPDPTRPLEERVTYIENNAELAGLAGLSSLFGSLPFGQPNTYTASVVLTQPLYTAGRVGAALKIAREYKAASEYEFEEQRAEAERNVRRAYFSALLAQELERIADTSMAQATAFRDQVRLQLDAGQASELDLLRADVALENIQPQLVEAKNGASLALLELKRLVNLPLDAPVALSTPLAVSASQLAAAAGVGDASLLSDRAALRAAERGVRIRQSQLDIARKAWLPSLDFRMAYGKQIFPQRVFGFGDDPWRTDWTASLALTVPIFDGFRRSAEKTQAQITLDQERLRLSQLSEQLRVQYEQAVGERQRAASAIAARQRTVDQAARVYELTVLRFERGLSTQLEVADARLALLQARTNYAQSVADLLLADADVARALAGTSGASR